MSFPETGAVILVALGVWLTAQRNVLCWPVGLASVLLYGWIFWGMRLYSDVLLQGVYAMLALYGWRRWSTQRPSEAESDVHRLRVMPIPRRTCLIGILAGAVSSAVLGALMAQFTDATLPWIDAALANFSLVAEFWKARRYIAHWRLWIVIDCVYILLFMMKGLPLTAFLYAGLILLARTGLKSWRGAYKQQQVTVKKRDQAPTTMAHAPTIVHTSLPQVEIHPE